MSAKNENQRWFVASDLNGFFGLAFDNLTVLSFMAGILIFAFQFPAEVVFRKMFPGSALGVLVADLIYTVMAVRLARRTGNPNVTAMPLGLDTPSSIGLSLTVLGPAFIAFKGQGMTPDAAAIAVWQLGMATMVLSGVVKFALSFAGAWVQRIVPQAGLLGSLAGVGLVLIGFLPLIDVFSIPLIGFISLGIIFYALTAGNRLPGNIPPVLAAVVVGTALYYLLARHGLIGGTYVAPSPKMHMAFPWPSFEFLKGIGSALKYLPISIPFALVTVVGGINNSESARVAGDTYNTRDILLAEAVATLAAGFCGGVAQTTPYIGHPAYKRMGCRAGYTLLTALFIGFGGIIGYNSFIVEIIPQPVVAPILVFVGLEITCQAFLASPHKHAPAVAFTFLPTMAQLMVIKFGDPSIVPPERFTALLSAPGPKLPEMLVTVALANGFILTAMLWGAIVAHIIDRRVKAAAAYAVIAAVMTWFGLIHSPLPSGNMYLPWTLTGLAKALVNQVAIAYLVLAAMLVALGARAKEPA